MTSNHQHSSTERGMLEEEGEDSKSSKLHRQHESDAEQIEAKMVRSTE